MLDSQYSTEASLADFVSLLWNRDVGVVIEMISNLLKPICDHSSAMATPALKNVKKPLTALVLELFVVDTVFDMAEDANPKEGR